MKFQRSIMEEEAHQLRVKECMTSLKRTETRQHEHRPEVGNSTIMNKVIKSGGSDVQGRWEGLQIIGLNWAQRPLCGNVCRSQ